MQHMFNYIISDRSGDSSAANVNIIVIHPTDPTARNVINAGSLKNIITNVANKEASVKKIEKYPF